MPWWVGLRLRFFYFLAEESFNLLMLDIELFILRLIDCSTCPFRCTMRAKSRAGRPMEFFFLFLKFVYRFANMAFSISWSSYWVLSLLWMEWLLRIDCWLLPRDLGLREDYFLVIVITPVLFLLKSVMVMEGRLYWGSYWLILGTISYGLWETSAVLVRGYWSLWCYDPLLYLWLVLLLLLIS